MPFEKHPPSSSSHQFMELEHTRAGGLWLYNRRVGEVAARNAQERLGCTLLDVINPIVERYPDLKPSQLE